MWKSRQMREEYEKEFGVLPTSTELADLLGVSLDTLEAVIACGSTPISIDKPIRYSNGDSGRTIGDIVPDVEAIRPDEMLDRQKLSSIIRGALSTLTEREEKIMRMRFGIEEDPSDHSSFPITAKELKEITKRKRGVA